MNPPMGIASRRPFRMSMCSCCAKWKIALFVSLRNILLHALSVSIWFGGELSRQHDVRACNNVKTYKFVVKVHWIIDHLADVFRLPYITDLFAQVSTHSTFKYLHHESEHGTSECSVPTTLWRFVTNESVLGLHLQELYTHRTMSWVKILFREIGITEGYAPKLPRYDLPRSSWWDPCLLVGHECPVCRKPSISKARHVLTGKWKQMWNKAECTTTSPLPVNSPLRTRMRVSSLLPLPRVAEWMSVAKKQKAERTRGSKAACGRINVGLRLDQA